MYRSCYSFVTTVSLYVLNIQEFIHLLQCQCKGAHDAMKNFVVHNTIEMHEIEKLVSIHYTVHNNTSCHHKNYRKEYSPFQKQQAHYTGTYLNHVGSGDGLCCNCS